MTVRPSFAILLQAFFSEHLVVHKHASPQTVDSYRDTFRLLLNFLHKTVGIAPAKLRVEDLDGSTILTFLDHLERERKCCIGSRNARLAAIRSFFRYAVLRDPESAPMSARVLGIPSKRVDRRVVGYLTRSEINALLAAPNRSKSSGRRDHALLLSFYNTGARLSEMTGLKQSQVQFGHSTFVHLHGKGRKERDVPLWANTARTLRAWFDEIRAIPGDIAFPNARGGRLSGDGVRYILGNALKMASLKCPSLNTRRITPHQLRHSTAMHLLQAGVDISVIALWLGHESIQTTHMYVEADLATKERALGKLIPLGATARRFKADDALLTFLASL